MYVKKCSTHLHALASLNQSNNFGLRTWLLLQNDLLSAWSSYSLSSSSLQQSASRRGQTYGLTSNGSNLTTLNGFPSSSDNVTRSGLNNFDCLSSSRDSRSCDLGFLTSCRSVVYFRRFFCKIARYSPTSCVRLRSV